MVTAFNYFMCVQYAYKQGVKSISMLLDNNKIVSQNKNIVVASYSVIA